MCSMHIYILKQCINLFYLCYFELFPYHLLCTFLNNVLDLPCTCARSLSMVHDSQGNSCPDEGGVMAASLGRGLAMYEWSSCSASELRSYRIGGGTKCLMETDPANSVIKSSFPGREFNLTYQCKAMFGDRATVCSRPWYNSAVSS